eukprot:GHVT01059174.1.p1 GENE.GHVT01059174.1~~GHVT01059174.1.p1  ORF type:complete len:313 (-),score=54.41 GHVT01059174.1:699-1637(-)
MVSGSPAPGVRAPRRGDGMIAKGSTRLRGRVLIDPPTARRMGLRASCCCYSTTVSLDWLRSVAARAPCCPCAPLRTAAGSLLLRPNPGGGALTNLRGFSIGRAALGPHGPRRRKPLAIDREIANPPAHFSKLETPQHLLEGELFMPEAASPRKLAMLFHKLVKFNFHTDSQLVERYLDRACELSTRLTSRQLSLILYCLGRCRLVSSPSFLSSSLSASLSSLLTPKILTRRLPAANPQDLALLLNGAAALGYDLPPSPSRRPFNSFPRTAAASCYGFPSSRSKSDSIAGGGRITPSDGSDPPGTRCVYVQQQ